MNKLNKLTTVFMPAIISLTLSASCSIAGDMRNTGAIGQSAEALYGIQLKQDTIAINVKSNGCTKAEHFDVQLSAEHDQQALLIVRNKPDRCRKMPKIIRVELRLPTATKSHYRLVNSLQAG